MNPLVIFGARGFAEMAHYYFTRDSRYTVAAFTVDAAYLEGTTFQGLPVVAFEELETRFAPDTVTLFIAMGIQKVNRLRAQKVADSQARGYRLASYLSSKAKVADDLTLHPNSFIMEDAYLQPNVTVGRNSIIWAKSAIGFRSRIGDHCWIVSASLGESVTVGDYTLIGINATIASFLTIGASNVIGAGALVLEDTQDDSIYKGHASERSRVPSHRLRRI
jgi:sugar O-acyltransferase (sialic acid O-acetyltransferase NeuD family)